MFSISKSQFRILAENTVEAYLDLVTTRIRLDFPSELGALPGEVLRLRVKAAFERFRTQGFHRKEYLHRLIVLELLFGPQFETSLPPAVRRFAFPPPSEPCPSEPERFWTIYRTADQLTRGDTRSAAPSADKLARGEQQAMTGIDALNRSQASAEAEAGSINRPVKECLAWIGVSAIYDDPWATPVTGCQVRIRVEGGIVADGPRTKGLSAYGKEDGQPHDDVRAELGVYRQSGVKPGPVVIALVPDGHEDPKGIEKQILSNLETFEASMRQLLQPWLVEWSKDGWFSVPAAERRGQLRGLGAWWEVEMDSLASVGNASKEAWNGIKSGASKVADWYEDLAWHEKRLPLLAISRELVEWLTETAQTLWDRRDQLMKLLKALHEGTAAAIEKALEALIDLPGELGTTFKELVQHSAEWVQNMIEVARETDVFKRAGKTIMTVVMMMTPNFWAEGIGMVEGYLLPEVLLTIALIIIGALCAAAGALALTARIVGILSKLRKAIAAAGKAGKVLTTLFGKLDELAKLIGNLSKALRRRIDEVVNGVTDRLNKLVRRSTPLSNAEIRKWYNDHVGRIPELNQKWIKEGVPLQERARRAHAIRHDARMEARRMMANPEEVAELQRRDLKEYGNLNGPTFEHLVDKARRKGLKGDDIYEDIIGSSNRTNEQMNQRLLGGERPKR